MIAVSYTHLDVYKRQVTVFDDWTVSKVDRKTEGSIETFSATYISASAKEYEYKPEASISIDVYTGEESIDAAASFAYTTTDEKTWIVFDAIGFNREN